MLSPCPAAPPHPISSHWDKTTSFPFRQAYTTSSAGLSFPRSSPGRFLLLVFPFFAHLHLRRCLIPAWGAFCLLFFHGSRALLTPLQNPSGGAARASGRVADSAAARMLVSPATDPVRFCEEGLPAGSACSIVALPLQLASSLLQGLKIE